ncbi:MAG: hypothetical protein JO368_00945 [Acidimicrobiales bacterium]|nr:hypothetical protein [Acidimicrobiales bacterium]
MELARYLAVLRQRWAILVALAVVGSVGAALLTPHPRTYLATTKIYVGPSSIDFKTPSGVAGGDVGILDRYVQTFANMIQSHPVVARGIQLAGVSRSTKAVFDSTSARQETGPGGTGTQLLDVDVTDKSALDAQKLANGVAQAFVQDVQSGTENVGSEGSVPQAPAYIFETAQLPTRPEPSGLVLNVIIGALLGFGVAVAGVLLADYLDVTVRGVADAERRLHLPVLGVVPPLGASARPAPKRRRRSEQRSPV